MPPLRMKSMQIRHGAGQRVVGHGIGANEHRRESGKIDDRKEHWIERLHVYLQLPERRLQIIGFPSRTPRAVLMECVCPRPRFGLWTIEGTVATECGGSRARSRRTCTPRHRIPLALAGAGCPSRGPRPERRFLRVRRGNQRVRAGLQLSAKTKQQIVDPNGGRMAVRAVESSAEPLRKLEHCRDGIRRGARRRQEHAKEPINRQSRSFILGGSFEEHRQPHRPGERMAVVTTDDARRPVHQRRLMTGISTPPTTTVASTPLDGNRSSPRTSCGNTWSRSAKMSWSQVCCTRPLICHQGRSVVRTRTLVAQRDRAVGGDDRRVTHQWHRGCSTRRDEPADH